MYRDVYLAIWKGLPLISGIAACFQPFPDHHDRPFAVQSEAVQQAQWAHVLGSTSGCVCTIGYGNPTDMGFGLGLHMGMAGFCCFVSVPAHVAPKTLWCRPTGP